VALVGPEVGIPGYALIERARSRGLARRFHLLPPRTGASLGSAYAAADVFVLASRWEGLSLALLDALALGLPALVTPEVGRTIDLTGAGWSAPIERWPDHLRMLLELSPDAYFSMRTGARSLAMRYDWQSSADAFIEAVRKCAANVEY
jgi:glycosyltransferase involved in cell wall biosynthesis